jgi:hypothetical protein
MHAWQFARALGISERHGWTRLSMQNLVNLSREGGAGDAAALCGRRDRRHSVEPAGADG